MLPLSGQVDAYGSWLMLISLHSVWAYDGRDWYNIIPDYTLRGQKLPDFYIQFQKIGNNYNQTLCAVKANFGEKRAMALLYNLKKLLFNS